MRKIILGLCCLATLGSCIQVKKPKKEVETEEKITEEEALELLHDWTDAYLKGNADRLNDVLDDTWEYSGSSDGSTSSKTATIEEFRSADYSFGEITYENLDVRLYGDVAVVRGSERMTILDSSKQDTTVLRLRFTDVYQKKDGNIKAIATHSSPID
ncbi:nuclear transport factor 2 family protein [Flagellimonas nanhaiensis]|uniref:Nuclear transport factor 2 family protein n=1 Tax=Flagellimonas nanhaiensis TaxID=2292706 RepID=A0A371JP24_9FLAO|nr:nuclear transport factor 2 family protein [Allomuricauda nanhaiensis]RDY59282.1 nuclear transport factor 2 family protein [Allomuricauda nanhaiensis]